jgi:hypothetical protein
MSKGKEALAARNAEIKNLLARIKDMDIEIKRLIEIEKRRSGDIFRLYIEIDGATWYLFEYKLNILTVISSDAAFLEILTAVKDENRRFEDGKKKFSWSMLASKKKRDDLLDRYPSLNE